MDLDVGLYLESVLTHMLRGTATLIPPLAPASGRRGAKQL
jgi:hypothetical protein